MTYSVPEEEKEEAEDWLTTYADAITLLMAFFVMLLSFSKVDMPLYEKVTAGIRNEIGNHDIISSISLMQIDLRDVVYQMQADEAVDVQTDDRGVVIELASSAFYKPGSAEMRDQALAVLEGMVDVLSSPRYQTYLIEVEGHTDDDPISTERYPSNWELSAGRAARVVRFFIDRDFEQNRLKASGYAETRPKLPNRDSKGQAIPDNQAANRRVIVRVYSMSLHELQAFARQAVPGGVNAGGPFRQTSSSSFGIGESRAATPPPQ